MPCRLPCRLTLLDAALLFLALAGAGRSHCTCCGHPCCGAAAQPQLHSGNHPSRRASGLGRAAQPCWRTLDGPPNAGVFAGHALESNNAMLRIDSSDMGVMVSKLVHLS